MSKYSEKLFSGQIPTDSDWAEHLIEAHKITPSMTPYAFAPYKTKEGKNSYEILAETLLPSSGKAITVVDLACGDGHLIQYLLPHLGQEGKVIGVDMSEAELTIARKTYREPRIQFQCTEAQTLPIQDQSVDYVLSHMAFMLMLPVEPVVAELARVLKPAGKFSAVIGNPKGRQGLFGDMMKVAFQFMDSRHPKIKEAKTGDSRVNSEEGLARLFNPNLGFSRVSAMHDFELLVDIAPSETWDWVKDMYFIGMLPESEKVLLKEELITFAKTKSDSTGRFKFSSPMRKFSVEKSEKR